jgi:hypothetical protein
LEVQQTTARTARTDTSSKDDAVTVSVEVSRRAHSMAMMVALILALGAALAAITAAFVAFLALRGWKISW